MTNRNANTNITSSQVQINISYRKTGLYKVYFVSDISSLAGRQHQSWLPRS